MSALKGSGPLLAALQMLMYPRKGYDIRIAPSLRATVKEVEAPLLEISSSFIRQSAQAGKDVRFFLPECMRTLFPEKKHNKI